MKRENKINLGMPFDDAVNNEVYKADDNVNNEVYTDAERTASIEKYNKYQLFDMLEEAQKEIKELKEYVLHKPKCDLVGFTAVAKHKKKCSCGLDELLNKH